MTFAEEITKLNERVALIEDQLGLEAKPEHLLAPEVKPDLGPTTPMPEADRQALFANATLGNIATQTGEERTEGAQANVEPESAKDDDDDKGDQPPSDQKSDEQQKADQERFQQAQTAPADTAAQPVTVGENYTAATYEGATVQDKQEAAIVVAEHKEEGENGNGQ